MPASQRLALASTCESEWLLHRRSSWKLLLTAIARGEAMGTADEWGLFTWLCLVQGSYFLFTGIWPLVSIGTFQLVTGPKTDLWLVKTVGVLVGVIGAVLLVAGLRQNDAPEIVLLAVASAMGLTAIDVIYVAKGRIGPAYMLDANLEVILLLGWAALAVQQWA